MQNIQTWSAPAAFDPTNPDQLPLQYWSAADMGYRSAYWNEQPTTVKNLAGLMPTNRFVQAGLVAGLATAAFFTFKQLQKSGHFGNASREELLARMNAHHARIAREKGLRGPRSTRRRKRR